MASSTIHRVFGLALALLVALALWAMPGTSQAQEQAAGKAEFDRYCAGCHGMNAEGDGPLATLLTVKPANLTLLARKNKGVFPGIRVAHIIDGRTTVRAHGPSDMPIWGRVFTKRPTAGNPAETARRSDIQQIVSYLQSVQKK